MGRSLKRSASLRRRKTAQQALVDAGDWKGLLRQRIGGLNWKCIADGIPARLARLWTGLTAGR
jgi:hypothetical protein